MYILLHLVLATSSAVFLLLLPFRLRKLRTETLKLIRHQRGHAKLLVAVVLLVVQLIRTITALSVTPQSSVEIVSAITSFAACLGLCPLLVLEHTRSIKPSDLVVVYLLMSSACDSIELGIIVSEHDTFSMRLPAATQVCIKLVLLVMESRGKEIILRGPHGQWPPEQVAGLLNRTLFWWINSVLAQGSRGILTSNNLPLIDQELSSKLLRHRALRAWDQRAKPENKMTLPKVVVLSMLPHFLSPIFPRLFLIVFRYAQPVLISTTIRYIGESTGSKTGFLVIFMAAIVYAGLAISGAVYQHRLDRLKIMIKGTTVGLINAKSINQESSNYDDGRAVTLMSIDADDVAQTAQMFHETWAQILEVLLGMGMLAHQVGWIWPVPLVIIFFCSRMSRYLAKNLKTKQKNWNEATQKRLAITTSMLASVKGLKMLGMVTYMESFVQSLRMQEIAMAKKVRWMMVAYNASANALGIFSPIITFVLFVVLAKLKGSILDTETAFTTTALLGLVTHPANMIMTIVPQAVGSMASFERIQQYLLEPPRRDQRLGLKEIDPARRTKTTSVICIEKMTIEVSPSLPPILENIDLVVNKGSLVMCSGPVGSGKTTLARALMGELPLANGTIMVSSKRIGLCAQSPWLPSGTIREAVCGFSPEEEIWYKRVIRLCCLDEDLLALPDGDQTLIGSRGLNLSGGQRQRVALARVVYARCEIVVLDDSLNAVDGKTEDSIMENLFGTDGLFKKMETTVFFITNATSHFHRADWLVVLGDSSVKYQGTWNDLRSKPKSLLKVTIEETDKGSVPKEHKLNSTVRNQGLKLAEAVTDLRRGTGDISLYGYYIGSLGYYNFLFLLVCTSSYSFFVTFPQYWLKWWTEAPPTETWFYVGGYLILSLMAWVSTNGSMWSTYILIAPKSGAELHRRLLSTIIGAPLSYFSNTDTGTILNRFGQDIQLVDGQLPRAILSMSNQIFKLIVQTTLLFSAQKIMALTFPFCIVTVYLVQKIYLRTSRQLRLLQLESQSAVYSSFLESVEGVATIRAFGWEKEVENKNINCLDEAQRPSYILLCLQRWLNLVLDLMIAAIAIGVIGLAVLMRGTTNGGQIGMALNIVLVANTTLVGLVQSWTNLEISLGAISRLKTLEIETPKEDNPSETYTPVETWPSSGVVEFDKVTVAYNPEVLALQNITMTVSEGQQFVICGRTGSGKSTLLLTLLRLLDLQSGTITIDGIDISKVPRSIIRQRCFITISQDSLVFGQASLRFNLDLSGLLSDRTIVAALQKTRLWSHFTSENTTSSTEHQILNYPITSLPQMSTGQSQLFALARALLQIQVINHPSTLSTSRPNLCIKPILLLDEATSSVDPDTESVMRSIIQQEFTQKGHTVIAITHRLSGVMEDTHVGPDMVVLLSNGKVERIGAVEDVLG